MRTNASIWVRIEWYLHVVGFIFLVGAGVCVVVCMVLVLCTVVKDGVKDLLNILLCVGSWLHVCFEVLDEPYVALPQSCAVDGVTS